MEVDETITDDELIYLVSSIDSFNGRYVSPVWRKAFRLYNEDPGNAKLGMGCRPCYTKVAVYFLKKRLT